MKPITLTKDYRFTTEPSEEGFRYELLLTEEDNQVTLRRIDFEFEREECFCAQGVLSILKELVWGINYYYANACVELEGIYESALSVLVYKLFTHKEVKHLMKALEVHTIVDLIEILLAKGSLDYLGDML